MQKKSNNLTEGLRPNDLDGLVYPTLEIDTYRSKMGEDRDVCVVSLQVKDRSPAKDLMEFVEKGYNFVLDADISAGENEQGEYSVFIELNRSPKLAEEIRELTYGIRKLSGIGDFKFRYHKQSDIRDVTEDTLRAVIPATPKDYDGLMQKAKTESVRRFFNKTLMDDITLDGDIVTIHKPYGNQLKFKIVKEDSTQAILETTEAPFAVDDAATAEVFWMTKVLGNYNINKINDTFVLDNNGQAMILKRID